MGRQRRCSGYSLIELVILFLLVGLVFVFVVMNWDKFAGKPAEKKAASENNDVKIITLSIERYSLKQQNETKTPAFPRELDSAPVGTESSATTPLFSTVIDGGIQAGWTKVGINQYVYGPPSKDTNQNDMKNVYSYDPETGKFTKGSQAGNSITWHAPGFPIAFPVAMRG